MRQGIGQLDLFFTSFQTSHRLEAAHAGPDLEQFSGQCLKKAFACWMRPCGVGHFRPESKQDYRARDLVKRTFPFGFVDFGQLASNISTKTLDLWSVACSLLAPSRPGSLLLSVDSPGRPSYKAGQSALRSVEPRPGRLKKVWTGNEGEWSQAGWRNGGATGQC